MQSLNHFSALMSLWCKCPVLNNSMQRKGVLTVPPFGKSNGITMLLITTVLYINVIYIYIIHTVKILNMYLRTVSLCVDV